MTLADNATLSDYFSGRYGNVSYQWRFEARYWDNSYISDLTPYVTSFKCQWDYYRDAMRVADFEFLPGFDTLGNFYPGEVSYGVAAFIDVTVDGTDYEFQIGLFSTPFPELLYDEAGNSVERRASMNCPDMMGALLTVPRRDPTTFAPGSNIVQSVIDLIGEYAIEVDIPIPSPTPITIASGYTWPAGTTAGQIVKEALDFAGLHRPHADSTGTIRSGEWSVADDLLDPSIFGAFSAEDEPRFITGQARRTRNASVAFNEVRGQILDPANPDFGAGVWLINLFDTPVGQNIVGQRVAFIDDASVADTASMSRRVTKAMCENLMSIDRVSWAMLIDPRIAEVADADSMIQCLLLQGFSELSGTYAIVGWSLTTGQNTVNLTLERVYPGPSDMYVSVVP